MESVALPGQSVVVADEYLILDSEEVSFPGELSEAEQAATLTFRLFSSIESMEERYLDRAALAYCHFSHTLTRAFETLQTTYQVLQKKTEFDQWRDHWNLLKALTIKLQSKLLSLEGALPLFLDEKTITVTVDGTTYQSSKAELEALHRSSLELVTATANELTRDEVC